MLDYSFKNCFTPKSMTRQREMKLFHLFGDALSLSRRVVCYILLHACLRVDTSACLCPDLFGMQPPLKQPGPPLPATNQDLVP